MSLIHCPYCQSTNVRQVDSGNTQSDHFKQIQRAISPAHMAFLGMRIAKKLGAPPIAGAAVGVVIGGVLIVVSQFYFEKYYGNATHFVCQDCQQQFAWVEAD